MKTPKSRTNNQQELEVNLSAAIYLKDDQWLPWYLQLIRAYFLLHKFPATAKSVEESLYQSLAARVLREFTIKNLMEYSFESKKYVLTAEGGKRRENFESCDTSLDRASGATRAYDSVKLGKFLREKRRATETFFRAAERCIFG